MLSYLNLTFPYKSYTHIFTSLLQKTYFFKFLSFQFGIVIMLAQCLRPSTNLVFKFNKNKLLFYQTVNITLSVIKM